MIRRRSGVIDFFNGLTSGYDTAGKLITDYKLSQVANAKPEQQTDTTYQGMTGGLDQQDIPTTTKYNYLGQTFDAQPTQGQMDKARLSAMSGVYDQMGDPLKAIQLRQQSSQADLLNHQVNQANRQEKDQATRDTVDNDVGAYIKQNQKINPDGTVQPPDDTTLASAAKLRAIKLADNGMFDEALKAANQGMQYSTNVIQNQTQERSNALKPAVSAAMQGNFEPLKTFYNTYIPDGAQI
ncbi:MAG TPA: hypothetical protein VFX23_01710, partial [Limnobacter sp.]|uniref:hypothetical protein n=1 Tax=Limnobacter sp. TaxID=2003368 RepID=UPI002E33B6B4